MMTEAFSPETTQKINESLYADVNHVVRLIRYAGGGIRKKVEVVLPTGVFENKEYRDGLVKYLSEKYGNAAIQIVEK